MMTKELREKSIDDLKAEYVASLKELFNLRMQKGYGQPPKSHHFRNAKRYIARLKTIMNEKGIVI